MTLYGTPEELDRRTRSRFESVTMDGEEFVIAGRASDGLLPRWSTRVVVTTERVLSIRHVVLEWSVEGVRHRRITNVRAVSGDSPGIVVEEDRTFTTEYTFGETATRDALLAKIRELAAATA
ncbi:MULTISPECIES: hypothetical protein [Salinibaculum]|uniref:hypothetical protein n=1 Tax=Salinibaculum TaxID=2732368 RepID=UPI0030D297C0